MHIMFLIIKILGSRGITRVFILVSCARVHLANKVNYWYLEEVSCGHSMKKQMRDHVKCPFLSFPLSPFLSLNLSLSFISYKHLALLLILIYLFNTTRFNDCFKNENVKCGFLTSEIEED